MRSPSPSLALLMLGVAGCATAPAYRGSGVTVPARFREASSDSTPSFPATPPPPVADTGAPTVPAAAAAVVDQTTFWRAPGYSTLARLIDELLRANLDVQAAAARVRGARAARSESAFDLAPTVTASGGYTRQRLSAATFPIGFGSFPDQDIWD